MSALLQQLKATFNNYSAAVLQRLDRLEKRRMEVIAVSTTATASTTYVIKAGVTLTLPPTPTSGQWVGFVNLSGTTNVVIAGNGKKIMGLVEDFTLDHVNARGVLAYAGEEEGWVLITDFSLCVSPGGGGGGV